MIYDFSGSVIDSFEEVDPELWPQATPNGCIEFQLVGRNFLVYVNADMNGNGHGCQANICELGEGQSLGGMTKYWKIPADSLGKVNDSGLRVHCFAVEYGVDSEGFEEVTLFTFKAYNGMAVYKIGRNVSSDEPQPVVTGDVNGDGEVTIADANAVIDMILTGNQDASGDVNGDGEVGIADANAVIDIILQS